MTHAEWLVGMTDAELATMLRDLDAVANINVWWTGEA